MSTRKLYIAAYDVRDPGRLADALKVLRQYSTGGQKSVFECFLSPAEIEQLLDKVEGVTDLSEDRFILIRLDARNPVQVMGIGLKPIDPDFYYVG